MFAQFLQPLNPPSTKGEKRGASKTMTEKWEIKGARLMILAGASSRRACASDTNSLSALNIEESGARRGRKQPRSSSWEPL